MASKKITLDQAQKKAQRAALELEKAANLAKQAEAEVARIKMLESRDTIINSLKQLEDCADQIKDLDNDFSKDVKSRIRKIVKKAFGINFRITRVVKVGNKQTIDFTTEEIVAILKSKNATDESTGLLKKELQFLHGKKTINKSDCVFDNTAWSKRDKTQILDNGNRKKMLYWVNK